MLYSGYSVSASIYLVYIDGICECLVRTIKKARMGGREFPQLDSEFHNNSHLQELHQNGLRGFTDQCLIIVVEIPHVNVLSAFCCLQSFGGHLSHVILFPFEWFIGVVWNLWIRVYVG